MQYGPQLTAIRLVVGLTTYIEFVVVALATRRATTSRLQTYLTTNRLQTPSTTKNWAEGHDLKCLKPLCNMAHN
jgi:hypothetical protein